MQRMTININIGTYEKPFSVQPRANSLELYNFSSGGCDDPGAVSVVEVIVGMDRRLDLPFLVHMTSTLMSLKPGPESSQTQRTVGGETHHSGAPSAHRRRHRVAAEFPCKQKGQGVHHTFCVTNDNGAHTNFPPRPHLSHRHRVKLTRRTWRRRKGFSVEKQRQCISFFTLLSRSNGDSKLITTKSWGGATTV